MSTMADEASVGIGTVINAAMKAATPVPDPSIPQDAKEEQNPLVVAAGWHLIVRLPPRQDQTNAGVWKSEREADREQIGSIVAQVIAVGPDAYRDEKKFPNGAWCKLGDWVIFRRYAGTRFKLAGHECRILNDDSVEAVIDSPNVVESV